MPTVDELLSTTAATAEDTNEVFTKVDGYATSSFIDDYGPVNIINRKIDDFNNQILVEGDISSQYILFETERYQDGIDLTTKKLRIHWERPLGEDEEEGTIVGDNNAALNVVASDTHIRFGWLIPGAAAVYDGVLKVMPYAYSTDGSSFNYILKELYCEFTIHVGLAIDGGIAEPPTGWYESFVVEMDLKVDAAKNSANKAATSEKNAKAYEKSAADSKKAAAISEQNAANSAKASANSATVASNKAQAAANSEKNAKTSEENAKTSEKNAKASEEAANKSAEKARKDAEAMDDRLVIVSTGVYVATMTIPLSGWAKNANSGGNEDLAYQNELEINGVTEKFYPIVSLDEDSQEIAKEAQMSTLSQTDWGVVRVFSRSVPSADMNADIALLYANPSSTGELYEIPPATTETLGVVKIGENVSVEADGTISVDKTLDAETQAMLDDLFNKVNGSTDTESDNTTSNDTEQGGTTGE